MEFIRIELVPQCANSWKEKANTWWHCICPPEHKGPHVYANAIPVVNKLLESKQ